MFELGAGGRDRPCWREEEEEEASGGGYFQPAASQLNLTIGFWLRGPRKY